MFHDYNVSSQIFPFQIRTYVRTVSLFVRDCMRYYAYVVKFNMYATYSGCTRCTVYVYTVCIQWNRILQTSEFDKEIFIK